MKRTAWILVCLGGTTLGFGQFHLLVTETSAGAVGPWGGIQRFNFTGTGSSAVVGTGIAAGALSDPAGLAFTAGGELFVGNRHGNVAPSSLSRFLYDSVNDIYVANGTVTGNSLFGTHGLSVSNAGGIFASNVNGPISRFTLSGGIVTSNGTMGGGSSRDTFVSSDGQWLYVTQGTTGNLLKYSIATGNLVNTFGISGSAGLHNGNWRGSELYLAGFSSSTIHRLSFDANGDVSSSSIVASTNGGISLAFSPDLQEMYVPGHTSGRIQRYLFSGGSWVGNGDIVTGVHMGDIQTVVPEPATLAIFGLGLAALARRRRRSA